MATKLLDPTHLWKKFLEKIFRVKDCPSNFVPEDLMHSELIVHGMNTLSAARKPLMLNGLTGSCQIRALAA